MAAYVLTVSVLWALFSIVAPDAAKATALVGVCLLAVPAIVHEIKRKDWRRTH